MLRLREHAVRLLLRGVVLKVVYIFRDSSSEEHGVTLHITVQPDKISASAWEEKVKR